MLFLGIKIVGLPDSIGKLRGIVRQSMASAQMMSAYQSQQVAMSICQLALQLHGLICTKAELLPGMQGQEAQVPPGVQQGLLGVKALTTSGHLCQALMRSMAAGRGVCVCQAQVGILYTPVVK